MQILNGVIINDIKTIRFEQKLNHLSALIGSIAFELMGGVLSQQRPSITEIMSGYLRYDTCYSKVNFVLLPALPECTILSSS